MEKKGQIKQEILDEIFKSVRQLELGELVLKIHNYKIVQIEKIEKKRV